MKNFVEFHERVYNRGFYISTNMLVAIDDIARVVECADDQSLSNLVTKDGKIHTLNERYMDVTRKIKDAISGCEEE